MLPPWATAKKTINYHQWSVAICHTKQCDGTRKHVIHSVTYSFLPRDAYAWRVLYAVARYLTVRLSVCLSVRHTPIFYQNGYTYLQTISPSAIYSQSTLVFFRTKGCVNIPTGTRPLTGVSNATEHMKKSRFLTNISLLNLQNDTKYSFRMVPFLIPWVTLT